VRGSKGLAPGGIGTNKDITSGSTAANQAQANPNNPFGLLFDRQATIGVSGGFGSFDMGWNYTTAFSTMKAYDPFDYKFLAVAGAKSSGVMRLDAAGVAKTQDRAGNMVFKTKFDAVTVQLEYMVNNGDKAAQHRRYRPCIGRSLCWQISMLVAYSH
jgi:predicted porin